MVTKIHDIVLEDYHVKVCKIVMINISNENIFNILHKHLGMKKLLAKWVLQLLTVDPKQNYIIISKQCLDKFKYNSSKFLRHYITIDEKYNITHQKGRTRLKVNFSWQISSGDGKNNSDGWKGYGHSFLGLKGYNPHWLSVKRKSNLHKVLCCFTAKMWSVSFVKERVIFHQDNSYAHLSAITTAKLIELQNKLHPNPPYFLELTSCNFFLFPHMKKWLNGQRISSNSDNIYITNTHFEELKTFFRRIKEVRISLGKVNHNEKRLCWRIKCIMVCIFCFFIWVTDFSNSPHI